MKPTLAVLVLLIAGLAATAHANVGVFAGFGHSVELTSTEDVRMVSEDVTIVPGRGRFLFDGSVPGMDRVEYDCTFVLENRKDGKVTVPVGFPLDTQFLRHPYKNERKTSDLVAEYRFIAQEEGHQYTVRYVPGDREKKLRNLFLWDMTFAPRETKTLRVSYTMPISMTLASAAVDSNVKDYAKPWYRAFEGCMLERFGYVVETGKSWAGTIGKARFRVYVRGFEQYLRQRPVSEDATAEERAKTRKRYPVWNPMIWRETAKDGWKPDEKGFLELTFEDSEPDGNLVFSYWILFFPRTVDDLRRLTARLAPEGMSDEDRQDLGDIFREFNGVKTGNPRIRGFVENQVWHGEEPQEKIPAAVLEALAKE